MHVSLQCLGHTLSFQTSGYESRGPNSCGILLALGWTGSGTSWGGVEAAATNTWEINYGSLIPATVEAQKLSKL